MNGWLILIQLTTSMLLNIAWYKIQLKLRKEKKIEKDTYTIKISNKYIFLSNSLCTVKFKME